MDVNLSREHLRCEFMAASAQEQVTVEGECALAGSMRDAVTVLSVQAQAHVTQMQALTDRIGVKGRVCFQVLYTQGDLTRIRSIETTCDFVHELSMPGAAPGMRTQGYALVLETNGSAASGRMALRALLKLEGEAFGEREIDAVSDIQHAQPLCAKKQSVTLCTGRMLGEETSIIREEFDLPDRLQVRQVLTASGAAAVTDITGGNGRVGVSGVVELRVLHQPQQAGEALVVTSHEVPFQVSFNAQLSEEEKPTASVEVIDVMADSAGADKQRTMRVEAEIRVRLFLNGQQEAELLEDVYSTQGPILEPQIQEIDVHTAYRQNDVRESVRVQATLPAGAPPMDTVLTAFALPIISSAVPAGRRMNVEGVMSITLVYLPVDSDIPYAVKTREPFSMTFPVEVQEGMRSQVYMIECSVGPGTSDRAELRCLLGLHAQEYAQKRIRIITDITERPEEKQEHGFVLVWPAPGESRWDTARRLRVPPDSLRPAGANALMAFRK